MFETEGGAGTVFPPGQERALARQLLHAQRSGKLAGFIPVLLRNAARAAAVDAASAGRAAAPVLHAVAKATLRNSAGKAQPGLAVRDARRIVRIAGEALRRLEVARPGAKGAAARAVITATRAIAPGALAPRRTARRSVTG
jgi:hypothetical protein